MEIHTKENTKSEIFHDFPTRTTVFSCPFRTKFLFANLPTLRRLAAAVAWPPAVPGSGGLRRRADDQRRALRRQNPR